MNQIEDYIIVKNTISKDLCKSMVDECNTREWRKHQWNNYTTGEYTSESTKELDVMNCTREHSKISLVIKNSFNTAIFTFIAIYILFELIIKRAK